MKSKNYSSHLFIILICLLIPCLTIGCAASLHPEPAIPSHEARQQIANIQHTAPDTIRINAKVDYVDGTNNKRVVGQDLIFSAQTPLNMRITISAFDKAMATLVSDGTGFSLIDVSQNAYITGMATPDNIANILPVSLSAADLYRVINGQYPEDELAENPLTNQLFTWDNREGGYRLSMPLKNGNTQHVFYSWPTGDIFLITVTQGESLLYRYEASNFTDYEFEGKTWRFPEQILFSLPPQKTDVRLRVEKIDIGVEFSPAVFRLMPPAGANIIVLK